MPGPSRILSPEQEREVAVRYATGESALAISRSFAVNQQTIHNTLRRLGIPPRPEAVKRRLSEVEKQVALEACLGGATVAAAAKLVATSETTITRLLRAHRARGGVVELRQGRPPSCEIDHSAFREITPTSAYWMGFLFADGCVHQDQHGSPALVCGLGEKDLSHLLKLRTFLRSTHAITTVRHEATTIDGQLVEARTCVYWRARSKQLCDALRERGLVKKRTREPAPELVASRDFWRGELDGDGSLGVTAHSGGIYPCVSFLGQRSMMEAAQRFLTTNQLAAPSITPARHNLWRIQIQGSGAVRTIRALYSDVVDDALNRKWARARAIIDGKLHLFPPYIEGPGRVDVDESDLQQLDDQ